MQQRAFAAILGVTLAGCGKPSGQSSSAIREVDLRPEPREARLVEGREAYTRYCVGCHGENGDGNGAAARFLHPRPRNFQAANFKFSSARAGQLPTDDDLRRSIRDGLRGSAMPSFSLLPDRTVDALVSYLKTFSPNWADRRPGAPVPVVEDPFRRNDDKSAAVARGEAVYHGYSTCWTCHPAYVTEAKINEHLVAFGNPKREGFRPDLNNSEGKPNTEGEVIFPPDFRRDFVRAGMRVEDLYRSIASGITGTAMPTWVDSMHMTGSGGKTSVEQADLWAMAYYVRSLIAQRDPRLVQGAFAIRDRAQRIYAEGERPEIVSEQAPVSTGQEFKEDN